MPPQESLQFCIVGLTGQLSTTYLHPMKIHHMKTHYCLILEVFLEVTKACLSNATCYADVCPTEYNSAYCQVSVHKLAVLQSY